MYAVIKTGGKQQKVKPGDIIEIEHLSAEGETVTFHPLLVVDDDGKTHYGKDAQGAVVTAKLLGAPRGRPAASGPARAGGAAGPGPARAAGAEPAKAAEAEPAKAPTEAAED